MCRFNFIMIKDESAEEILEREKYQIVNENLCGYRAYHKGYCDCGSFVGSLIERKGMKYHEAMATYKKEKLDLLYQIRNLMNEAGYMERKEKFLQIRLELSNEFINTFNDISDYQNQQTELIQNEYSGKELNNQMEKLNKEIVNTVTSLETQPDYIENRESYMKFLQENELMNESRFYYLTKEEEDNSESRMIPNAELLGGEYGLTPEEIEMIEIQNESRVIDEVIARTEKDNFEKNLKEYNSYYKLFSDIIKYVPSFMFCTIWSEPNEIKKVKTVGIDSLLIDDLAFLDFDEMICITK